MVEFEKIKNTYESCSDFEHVFTALRDGLTHGDDDFLLQYGYIFHTRKLYIPRTSLREFLVWELHVRGLLDILDGTRQLKPWNIISIGQA